MVNTQQDLRTGEYALGGVIGISMQELWKSKIPLKLSVFVWQLLQDNILSREQLMKRNGPEDGKCILCGEIEDADHINIMFRCPVAVYMWASIREALNTDFVPDCLHRLCSWGGLKL